MRTPRKSRLGRGTAERLLSTARDPAFPELSLLLAAASAPPQPHEPAGLDAALAAFHEAGRVGRSVVAPRRRLLRPLAAAAALATMLAGGVAVAAETGNLPGVGGTPTEGPTATATAGAAPEGTRAAPGRSGIPSVSPTPGGHGRTLSPASPALTGLCRAWDAHRRNPNQPLKSEAMRDLAEAAGGEARIPAFCAPVLTDPTAPATARPDTVPPTPSHPAGKGPARPTPSAAKKGQDG
ncbi:hypothetical protein GCM10022251_48900 [Phytohabitans flavus]|uniref:Uncharacterized protein n=1 Tax=Phytohabitans flavus TaxID=1076124 RepID=A0A6F8XSM2_9ACTN|nr:hypothetical protein [Phytohabitans flavus]BCB76852.1 hypothetical protein Pflav_032620 [Phytohabitans flavus]